MRRDDSHLWSERYDRVAIQDDIARTIVTTLQVKLSHDPAERRRHTPDAAAYENLLRASHIFATAPQWVVRSREYIQRAIALDPEFAAAHAALGNLSYVENVLGLRPVRDTIAETRAALLRALELNENLFVAHEGLAMNFHYRGRSDEALASAERAHALGKTLGLSQDRSKKLKERQGQTENSRRPENLDNAFKLRELRFQAG